jgi:hypothetical protein
MEPLLAVVFLSAAGERLSEWLLKPLILFVSRWLDPGNQGDPDFKDWVERLVCAVPGVAWSLLVGLDIFAELGLVMPYSAGVISTAVLVGGGANLVHDILGMIPGSDAY